MVTKKQVYEALHRMLRPLKFPSYRRSRLVYDVEVNNDQVAVKRL